MGKAEKERFIQTLNSHFNNIHETFQLFDLKPPSSMDKVNWEEVLKMGDQVSWQATIVGMLWTGEKPDAKAIEENMEAYFNTLQGFLLFCHGSTMGAGPTLSSCILASAKQIVDCSFKLMMKTVSSHGSRNEDLKLVLPRLVGAVWEACSDLKKTPTTNITAIGRAMTQVAVLVKDILREMNELKPASSNLTDEDSNGSSSDELSDLHDEDDSSSDELGNDLSAEEMKFAQSGIRVVSETIVVIKELIRTITGLIKQKKPDDNDSFVDSLEKLLKLCQEIGAQIDELGACLYPPQEHPAIKVALEKISSIINEVLGVVESFESSSETFIKACSDLRSSIKLMEFELDDSCTTDIEDKMQNVSVCN